MSQNHRKVPARELRRFRMRVLYRDGFRCRRCHAAGKLEAHHRVPIALGGAPLDIDNGITLCRTCHFASTAKQNRKPLTPAEKLWKRLVEELAATSD